MCARTSERFRSAFGYPRDEARLRAVVRACALERDLEILPDGQETFVGERGISLSGALASLVSSLLLENVLTSKCDRWSESAACARTSSLRADFGAHMPQVYPARSRSRG